MRALLAIVLATACGGPAQDDIKTMKDYDGPGSEAWGSDDISCDRDADCLSGEACIDDVCQVARCSVEPYESDAPIGQSLVFLQEAEIGVLDSIAYQGGYYVDGYNGANRLEYDVSWDAGSGSPDDLSGGRFTQKRSEQYVVADASKKRLGRLDGSEVEWFDTSFAPIAVAAGDADGDGLDDAVAVSAGGKIGVCELQRGKCEVSSFSGDVEIIDVAMGDVDLDGIEEPVILLDSDGDRYLYVANLDAELTGQDGDWSVYVGDGHTRVAAADLDGDYLAEVITLGDGGWWGWSGDTVTVWDIADSSDGGTLSERFTAELDFGGARDLAAADTDADDAADVVVLDDDRTAHAFKLQGTSLSNRYSTLLETTADPMAIAMADHDGNAPIARLVSDEPEVIEGAVVPMMLMVLPPYDRAHSAEPARAMYGDSESTSEAYTDTVSMGMYVDVGVSGGMDGVFKASMSAKVSTNVSNSVTRENSRRVGARYSLEANPELYGPNHGGVVLSWGCFHGYTYDVDDPDDLLGSGADGGTMAMTVPVDGATSIWSTNRYNAMAEALGTLPVIEIPYEVGDVDSYPTEPETITGKSIDDADMVFPDPPSWRVSDAGRISWWLGVSETETNKTSLSTDLGASASINVGGVSVGTGGYVGWGQSYSIRVGSEAGFAGTLPPLPDDPDTPEDEYAEHAYSATPVVYRQHYVDPAGNDASFYVMSATATR